MTRTEKGEKPAITEGILAKTVWSGTSWNWKGKPARTGGQTRQIRRGKPAGTCGKNWPEPRVREISQNWGGKPTRTGRKKWPELGRENWPELGRENAQNQGEPAPICSGYCLGARSSSPCQAPVGSASCPDLWSATQSRCVAGPSPSHVSVRKKLRVGKNNQIPSQHIPRDSLLLFGKGF